MKNMSKKIKHYIMIVVVCMALAIVMALSLTVSALVANTGELLAPFEPTVPTVAVTKAPPPLATDTNTRGRAFMKAYSELTTYTSVVKNEWTLGWSESITVTESAMRWDVNTMFVAVLTATEKTEKGKMRFHVDQVLSIHESLTLPNQIQLMETPNPAIVTGKSYLFWGFLSGEDSFICMYAGFPDSSKEITVVTQDGGRQVYCNLNGNRHCPVYSELTMPVDEFMQTPTGQDWQKWILDGAYGTQNAMTVIGCEMLNGLLSFREGDAYMTEGEVFSESDHGSGTRVCLISRDTADKNGLTVGMEIPLTLYRTKRSSYDSFSNAQGRTLYTPQYNFSENGTWRIIGIYDTVAEEGRINQDTPIPDGAVIVPLESLEGDYSAEMPYELSFILPPTGEDAFERELVSIGFGEYMSYSTSEPNPVPALQEQLDQIAARLQRAEWVVQALSMISTVALLLLWSRMQKKRIERCYSATTPRRTVFFSFLWRAVALSAAAILLAWGLTLWSYPSLHTAVITGLGEGSGAELLALLPSVVRWLSRWHIPAIGILIGVALSCVAGTYRNYHYCYHDEKEEE